MGGLLKKISTEGASNPWLARCVFQIWQIREHAFLGNKELKEKFDSLHGEIWNKLEIANSARKKLKGVFDSHFLKLSKGEIFEKNGDGYTLNETIDIEINAYYTLFIISLTIAIKDVGKRLGGQFGFKCGAIYGKEKDFEDWAKQFITGSEKNSGIIESLRDDRKWLSKIITIRDNLVHHGGSLPDFEYDLGMSTVNVPDALQDIDVLWENGWKFIEDILIITLDKNLPPPLCIKRIPDSMVDPNNQIIYVVELMDEVLETITNQI